MKRSHPSVVAFGLAFANLLLLAPICTSACAKPQPGIDLAQTSTSSGPAQTDLVPAGWGSTYKLVVHSGALGQDRTVNLFLPADFNRTTRKYPVVFLTDGEYYFEPAVVAAHELSEAGNIPECIVAAIETPERRQDMTPPGMSQATSDGPDQRAEKFLRFIATELAPNLEKTYRAGGPHVLMGHSHGGILCAYAAAKWRKDLPFIVSLDAPMQLDQGWLEMAIQKSIPAGGRLRMVSLEVRFGWSDADWSRLLAAAPKDWTLERKKLLGETHESMYFAGFYQGLKDIFADFSQSQVLGLSGEEAFKHYLSIEPSYGAEIVPPEPVLQHAVMDLMYKGNGDLARRALASWRQGYGSVPNYDDWVTKIDEAETAMKGQPTVAELLALEKPGAEAMKPFLGTWKGYAWNSFDTEHKNEITVTFSLANGHGTATIVNENAPPEYRIEVMTYIKVTKAGIEFGKLNGMMPRGIVAHVGELNGAKLEGKVLFRGVYFKPARGEETPENFFSLTKQ